MILLRSLPFANSSSFDDLASERLLHLYVSCPLKLCQSVWSKRAPNDRMSTLKSCAHFEVQWDLECSGSGHLFARLQVCIDRFFVMGSEFLGKVVPQACQLLRLLCVVLSHVQ